jgi:acyl-CoA reductase-like NAD-dependent aldehyde dehydrogenase
MNEDRFEELQLSDAALVRSARYEIARASASLTARPLDEAAADQMRRALEFQPSARKALRRLQMGEHPAGPRLNIVSPESGRWSYDRRSSESSE